MFDWKIMAASFAALLVVSSVLVGGFGFNDILGQLQDWMGDSPLDGLISAPNLGGGNNPASVTFFPDSFSMEVSGASFDAGGSSLSSFTGAVSANMSSDQLNLQQADTDLIITAPLTRTVIEDASIASVSLEKTKFTVKSDALETSGDGVSLELRGFTGKVTLTPDSVLLDGNFTSVRGNGKGII